MRNGYAFVRSDTNAALPLITAHAETLSSPWDSYTEDNIFDSDVYVFTHENVNIGYACVIDGELTQFYVAKNHYRRAPVILEDFVREINIADVYVHTHDSMFTALLMEWTCETLKPQACFFSDAGRLPKPDVPAQNASFRVAMPGDMDVIVAHTGDFFDKFETRIGGETIFVLEDGGELLGCGIIERSVLQPDCVSIGMITCREHRRKGIAQTVLWNLKEWAYERGLRPVAGCWYYNVLSRRSLEAAGMVATGKSYHIRLHAKEQLPLRTGNPPGELVEQED